jgi:hypothetical protein
MKNKIFKYRQILPLGGSSNLIYVIDDGEEILMFHVPVAAKIVFGEQKVIKDLLEKEGVIDNFELIYDESILPEVG